MAIFNSLQVTNIKAGEDLRTHQFKAVALDDGSRAVYSNEAGGIILNKPASGENITCGWWGEMKFHAGGSITIDRAITVSSGGWFTAAGSGDYIVGRAKATVGSGSIGTGLFNFACPVYAMSSSQAWG